MVIMVILMVVMIMDVIIIINLAKKSSSCLSELNFKPNSFKTLLNSSFVTLPVRSRSNSWKACFISEQLSLNFFFNQRSTSSEWSRSDSSLRGDRFSSFVSGKTSAISPLVFKLIPSFCNSRSPSNKFNKFSVYSGHSERNLVVIWQFQLFNGQFSL